MRLDPDTLGKIANNHRRLHLDDLVAFVVYDKRGLCWGHRPGSDRSLRRGRRSGDTWRGCNLHSRLRRRADGAGAGGAFAGTTGRGGAAAGLATGFAGSGFGCSTTCFGGSTTAGGGSVATVAAPSVFSNAGVVDG